jgi:signal transduction histidine kinase/ActR/RegA family two-component response regulator
MRIKSFSIKTVILLILGVILALNVIQAVSFFLNIRALAYDKILNNTMENTFALTDSISRQFKAWNSLAEDTAAGVLPLLSADEPDVEAVRKYLVTVAKNKDGVASVQAANALPRKGLGGYFIAGNSDPTYLPDDPLHDNATWKYFTHAMDHPGAPRYFGPYFDHPTDKLMISLAYAIQDTENERILGCVLIDIYLENLIDIINKDMTVAYRDTFLITETGNLISDGDATRGQDGDAYVKMKDFFATKKLEAYRESVLGEDVFSHSGEDVLIYSAYVPAADWILVSTVPAESIYADANARILKNSVTCALIIFVNIVLGFIMMSVIKQERIKLVRMKDAAEAASRSKSDFLARMSHEIRTPLNAIIGMSELALREPSEPTLPEYLANIRQAGSNLLSIINDVLDLSVVESGSIRLVNVSYRLSSLINNVVNVIRVRFREKPILFIVNADAKLPNAFMGDEVRIRQILLNILSNAVKYTEKGFIKLTVSGTFTGENGIVLKFEVADSGIGIREEDMKELFGVFARLDQRRNRGIEGTGLGLAISKNLSNEMGGDITVSSVYGKGSVFTVFIPQGYTDSPPMAAVENPAEKAVLLYDGRPLYRDSVSATLENLEVPVTVPDKAEDFWTALETGRFPFAFVSPDVAERAVDIAKQRTLKTEVVILAALGETSSFRGIPVILMPAYAVPAANILNGVKATVRSGGWRPLVRFIAPDVRVLIVDDIMTNLKIARGLLAAYRMQTDICDNGESSVSMVKANRYDLIFMDHMMPGMDGIETTAAIRALEGEYFKNVPIVALTANALSGMEEMFLSNGFNGYLAKPIEINKLNEIMEKWTPMEKRKKWESAGEEP